MEKSFLPPCSLSLRDPVRENGRLCGRKAYKTPKYPVSSKNRPSAITRRIAMRPAEGGTELFPHRDIGLPYQSNHPRSGGRKPEIPLKGVASAGVEKMADASPPRGRYGAAPRQRAWGNPFPQYKMPNGPRKNPAHCVHHKRSDSDRKGLGETLSPNTKCPAGHERTRRIASGSFVVPTGLEPVTHGL